MYTDNWVKTFELVDPVMQSRSFFIRLRAFEVLRFRLRISAQKCLVTDRKGLIKKSTLENSAPTPIKEIGSGGTGSATLSLDLQYNLNSLKGQSNEIFDLHFS